MPLVTLLFLAYFFPGTARMEAANDCNNLEVVYTTRVVSSSQQTQIQVTVKGGKQPYYYFFLDKKKNPLTWEFDKSSLTVKGKAFPTIIRVIDAEGCTKTIEFTESVNK